jgi:inorganic pyrophosphatase
MRDKLFSNPQFWENMDQLVAKNGIRIDRPKGSRHPRFTGFVYPYDYGYLPFTSSTDGAEVDVWVGTSKNKKVTGILAITDMDKFDAEIKLLYSCTEKEMEEIYQINNSLMMKAVLIMRSF